MRILVTGGTNGMGKGVAKVLASMDHQKHEIIILGRSLRLGESVLEELRDLTGNQHLSFVPCDLAKLSDVKKAIAEIQEKYTWLDGIFINAGLGYAPGRVETEDGMDPHFQVNYLSQFMLVLNLLTLLENSESGGRIIFNVTQGGEIRWDDMQMKNKWHYETGVHQSMVAKRMLLLQLHQLSRKVSASKLSFVGFQIAQTVWSNQIHIIPAPMRIMATVMKWLGMFISIEQCGEIMAPLFTESQEDSLRRSGKMITWKKNQFIELDEVSHVVNQDLRNRLWDMSLALCADGKTSQIAREMTGD